MRSILILSLIFFATLQKLFSQCVVPVYSSSQANLNYVVSREIFTSGVKDECSVYNLAASNLSTSVEYIDGLGRTIQKVMQKGSPMQKDMIQPIEYDQAGRQPKQYLPYTTSLSDASYHSLFVTEQAAFYTNNASNNADKIINDLNPFLKTEYDNSPLNRITKTFPQGNAWQTGTDHSIRTQFRTNTDGEVRKWVFDYTYEGATGTTFYAAGTLDVTEITDEDGNKTAEYKDKQGQTLLKKQQKTATEYISTYYVYDDFGNLRYVVPPSFTAISISPIGTATDQNLFAYKYDAKQRVIKKKVPGGGATYFIYDKYDRLVLSQDQNQSATKKWSFTKYDIHGRILMTGIYTHGVSISLSDMQLLVNGTTDPVFEIRQASTTHGYSNQAWPKTDCEILTVNYYDDLDYNFNGAQDHYYNIQGLANAVSYNTSGLLTGTKTKILGTTNDWLKEIYFYDEKKRLIQTQKNNHLNIYNLIDFETTEYDFSGRPVITKEVQNRGAGDITVVKRYEYDHVGRLIKTWHKVNGNPEILLSQLKYNEAGQVVEKNLHSENLGTSFLQSVDYTYNIRGFLTGINNPTLYANVAGYNNDDNNDFFGMGICYEAPLQDCYGWGTPKFNGNISSITWKSSNSQLGSLNTRRSFYFDYDKLNRLIKGNHAEIAGGVNYYWSLNSKFTESIAYDDKGNISSLLRTGGSQVLIDELTYSYEGNRLMSLNDNRDKLTGFIDKATDETEYAYDANGNMTGNSNSEFAFEYNHLNLLSRFLSNSYTINYTHDASGKKLKKKVVLNHNGITLHINHYIGNVQYKESIGGYGSSGTFNYILNHEEGRVKPYGTGFKYEYDLKDHLGNVRITFHKNSVTGLTEIIQEDHYYPFGMKMGGLSYDAASGNQFLFNGKELQEEFNLYDYGARMYDPVISRFSSVDPLADQMPGWSPYNCVFNNPLRFTDPTGKSPEDHIVFNEKGQYLRTDINNEPDKIVVENSQTGKSDSYAFNDPKVDGPLLKGMISNLEKNSEGAAGHQMLFFMNDKTMDEIYQANDVKQKGSLEKYWFAYTESRGGKMDMSYRGLQDRVIGKFWVNELASTGKKNSGLDVGLFFIFNNNTTNVSYNMLDAGNYMWGQGMKRLGFSFEQTIKGSLRNDPNDPEADQRSIINGYYHGW